MSKVTVNAGICGFSAVIEAKADEDEMVLVDFKSNCPNFNSLIGKTMEFDPLDVCFGKLDDNEVVELFKPICPHVTCPVPIAYLKAVEVAGGLALPSDVSMKIEK